MKVFGAHIRYLHRNICMNCLPGWWNIGVPSRSSLLFTAVRMEWHLPQDPTPGPTAPQRRCLHLGYLLKTGKKYTMSDGPNCQWPWWVEIDHSAPLLMQSLPPPRPRCHLWCQAFCKFRANYSVRTRRRLSVNSEGEGDVPKTGDWQEAPGKNKTRRKRGRRRVGEKKSGTWGGGRRQELFTQRPLGVAVSVNLRANSCQSLYRISLRDEQKVAKNWSGNEVGCTRG